MTRRQVADAPHEGRVEQREILDERCLGRPAVDLDALDAVGVDAVRDDRLGGHSVNLA